MGSLTFEDDLHFVNEDPWNKYDRQTLSALSPDQRRELIDHLLRVRGAKKHSLHFRMQHAFAEAALDHYSPLGVSVGDFRDLSYRGRAIEDQLRHTVTAMASAQNEAADHDNYWQHQGNIVRIVKNGGKIDVPRDDVEHIANDYLELPYRVPIFERLLVDVLVATETYAFSIDTIGCRAKDDVKFAKELGGWGSPPPVTVLVQPHPVWRYIKSTFFQLLFWAVAGTAAVLIWGDEAASAVLPILFNLGLMTVGLTTLHLPFRWLTHARNAARIRQLLRAETATYAELSPTGPVSAVRVREIASKAADAGVVWPAPLFMLLDEVIKRNGRLADRVF
jgi:hypothetical protein